jgi:hypothetical protein
MRYCQNTTKEHSLSIAYTQHLARINDIIQEETRPENHNKINHPFNDEVGLKLDKVKESSNDEDIQGLKSMDMVLGMSDGESHLMLLVDFKLNCNGVKSISHNEFRNKIRCSRILLFGGGIPIHNTYLYIFNNEFMLKSETRRDISRKLNNIPVEVLTINELQTNYF